MKKLILSLSFLILFSCSKDPDSIYTEPRADPQDGKLEISTDGKIDYARALDIAKNAPLRFGGEFTKNLTKTVLKGEPIVSQGIVTKSGRISIDTLMYVFNYAEGGYAVVPTLDVESDLIAYVEEGKFNIQDTLNNDLSRFLVSLMIDYQQSTVAKYTRENFTTKSASIIPKGTGTGPMCVQAERLGAVVRYDFGDPVSTPSGVPLEREDYYKTRGCIMPLRSHESSEEYLEPLLTTTWNQREPYNWHGPKIGDNFPKAGCVAIAVSQIMAYHAHPSQYPQNMTSLGVPSIFSSYAGKNTALLLMRKIKDFNVAGSAAAKDHVSRFIAIIGYMLGNKWGLSSTGSNIGAAYCVFDYMGYSTGDIISYSGIATQVSLNKSQPVYIRGEENSDGHAWVIDGYKIETYHTKEYVAYFDERCNYNGMKIIHGTEPFSRIFFHHNFGWSGAADNGYYLDGVFDTSQRYEATGGVGSPSSRFEKIKIIPNIVKR